MPINYGLNLGCQKWWHQNGWAKTNGKPEYCFFNDKDTFNSDQSAFNLGPEDLLDGMERTPI